MIRPLEIGITGGIGAGKSLVCGIFKRLGVPAYDADSAARELMSTDEKLISAIKAEFGDNAYLPDGTVNRKLISQTAFVSPERIRKLNQLVHPRVAAHFGLWAQENSRKPYVLKEAALLFESGSYETLDGVIVVTAPEELRISRVKKRDPQRSADDIKRIMENQWTEEKRIENADYLIINDETTLILPQVLLLHSEFLKGKS